MRIVMLVGLLLCLPSFSVDVTNGFPSKTYVGQGEVKLADDEDQNSGYLQSIEFLGNEARFVVQEQHIRTEWVVTLTFNNGEIAVDFQNGIIANGACSENKCSYAAGNEDVQISETLEFYDDKLVVHGTQTHSHHTVEWRAELPYVQETGTTWSDTLLPEPSPEPPVSNEPKP